MSIDPRAVIAPGAKIGNNVSIAPYAIIDEHVTIGDDCQIGPHVYLTGNTTIGKGTEILSGLPDGMTLEVITGLGNGFDVTACHGRALLLGGGIGAAPLHQLCRDLRAAGREVTAILGFNSAAEIFLRDELEALGASVHIATADGSEGIKGLVTDALHTIRPGSDRFYVCGPMPMMRALYPLLPGDGEFSLEERMGCGTGLCFGCTVLTTEGPRRICHEGPVFKKSVLPW